MMVVDYHDLREALDVLLGPGLAIDPIDHAKQVALVTSILSQAFERTGKQCVLIGGSAIEVYAPGIFKSGDIDLIIDIGFAKEGARAEIGEIFVGLGFQVHGKHWARGDLFVEVPSLILEDPTDLLRVGSFVLRVIAKEILLADRVVGFKHWKHTAYGQQAIDMLAAFGEDVRMELLMPRLEREGATDAFEALRELSMSSAAVTDDVLRSLIERLGQRPL